jgi:hypothetical protein
MNKRIQELAEQCTTIYNSTTFPVDRDFDYEKFAELIVKECANVAKLTEADDGNDYKAGRHWAGTDILKHFGITE